MAVLHVSFLSKENLQVSTITRTITLSDRAPVKIIEDDWEPTFAHDNVNSKKRHITYRIHNGDKGAIVYAVQKRDGDFKAEHTAGYLCKVHEIAETIMDVAEEMEDKAGGDWMLLADRLIRTLQPVEI